MNCHRCGKPLEDGSQFCEECGAPVEFPQQPSMTGQNVPEKAIAQNNTMKKIALVLGTVCVVLVVAIVLLLVFRMRNNAGKSDESAAVQTVSVTEMTAGKATDEATTETMTMENIAETTAISSELSTQTECDNVYFFDEGNLLTDSEFSKVFSELQNTADKIDMNIGVWIGTTEIGDGSDADTADFCDNQYDDRYGINTDGVFLYLDMSGASHLYDYISTSGKGQFYYTNSSQFNRISDIFASMNPYLKRDNEDVPSALHEFCDDLEYYAEKGAPSDTYYTYNRNNDKYLIMQDGKVKEVSELPEEYTIGD